MNNFTGNLYDFVRAAWPSVQPDTPFVDGQHIRLICEHLQAVIHGEVTHNLLITQPPGTMKSLLTGVFAPAWSWIHHPSQTWLIVSHHLPLAIRQCVLCRKLIDSIWYQSYYGKGFQWDSARLFRGRQHNDKGGWMLAADVGTNLSVLADIVLVDDPHSVKTGPWLTRANEWFDTQFSSSRSRLIVAMSRTDNHDLAGHLLNGQEAIDGEWTHLSLPMRSEAGQLLWPDMWSATAVATLAQALGPQLTAAMLQQQPEPQTGA